MNEQNLKAFIGDGWIVTKVSNGFNIRMRKVKQQARIKTTRRSTLIPKQSTCYRCGDSYGVTDHHIVHKSGGGDDALDNRVSLCMNCHTGEEAIHQHKWDIVELIGEEKLLELKKRYGGFKP